MQSYQGLAEREGLHSPLPPPPQNLRASPPLPPPPPRSPLLGPACTSSPCSTHSENVITHRFVWLPNSGSPKPFWAFRIPPPPEVLCEQEFPRSDNVGKCSNPSLWTAQRARALQRPRDPAPCHLVLSSALCTVIRPREALFSRTLVTIFGALALLGTSLGKLGPEREMRPPKPLVFPRRM